MIESPTLSWVLTVLFAATGLWSLIRCVRSFAGLPVPGITGRISCAACAVMSVAMIGMSWSWGAHLPAGPEVAVFALATLWFVFLAARTRRHSSLRQPASSRLPHLHNALMMAAVVWMLTSMRAGMTTGADAQPTMAAAMTDLPSGATGTSLFNALLAAYFLLAAIPWLSRALHHTRTKRIYAYDAASQAAMSVGMGAMLLIMI